MLKAKIGNTLYEPDEYRQDRENRQDNFNSFNNSNQSGNLSDYFEKFRDNVIGARQIIQSPYGPKKLIYADWTASGRLYRPIERKMAEEVGPYVANTHSEASLTGAVITRAYEDAKAIIKRHVHAGPEDMILFAGTGMTGAVNKLQRMLGLRVPERLKPYLRLPQESRPVIFVTHMEHHSNYIPWAESIGEVVVVSPAPDGSVDPANLERLLIRYLNRPYKAGAFTACSNVTGFETPIHSLARVIHKYGGLCFADYSASAPYVDIDMHPAEPLERLDGILFSPHKFLGGPGTSGVLILDSRLCSSPAPDEPGGGTVTWTDPWGGYRYKQEPEAKEDGGTPGFMQAIRTALCIRLKEEMGTRHMLAREHQLTARLLNSLQDIPGVQILGGSDRNRLGIVSFRAGGTHYNLLVKMLSDRFGVQARGGCSCAGPYGHRLLGIDQGSSRQMSRLVEAGQLYAKPGWIRFSLHPVMTDEEVDVLGYAVRTALMNYHEWKNDYAYEMKTNEWRQRSEGNGAAGLDLLKLVH